MARNFTLALVCALVVCHGALGAEAAAKPICLSTSEAREEIKTHRLLDQFAVLKTAASVAKAEALSAKLCRLNDDFVYEIALLHRDGRLVHLVMNATTGKVVTTRNSREPPPRT
jgi:uncharacterized membrane protein YkoI